MLILLLKKPNKGTPEIIDETVGKDNTTIYLKYVTDMNNRRQKYDKNGNDNVSSFFKESYDFHEFFCKERLECNKTEEKYDNQSRKNANYKFYASCANSMHFTFCRRSCKFKLNSDYKS